MVVDQLHHVVPSKKEQNKYEKISVVTRDLQTLAMRTGAASLALHQVNRDANKKGIELHHLRDSGTIEQDARLVMLVTKCERDAIDDSKPAVLTIQIAKNSHGPRNRVFKLLAHFTHARIESYFPTDGGA